MYSWWEEETGKAKGNLEADSRERVEGVRDRVEGSRKEGSGQTVVERAGGGLMYTYVRRGLSKLST